MERRTQVNCGNSGVALPDARLVALQFSGSGLDKLLELGRRGWPVTLSGLKAPLETGRALPCFDSAR
jgi:hypothetical protein